MIKISQIDFNIVKKIQQKVASLYVNIEGDNLTMKGVRHKLGEILHSLDKAVIQDPKESRFLD